jgi:hypothetical protein
MCNKSTQNGVLKWYIRHKRWCMSGYSGKKPIPQPGKAAGSPMDRAAAAKRALDSKKRKQGGSSIFDGMRAK